ncbi:TonB-dependent siderophore receptor [uncultured Martelella sp.]|uniref:TonB-dependent siderophore receptor n=1 Tax=uncultured Martelella sp. TaxID=392331 RepID=UPI0029C87F1A|nr:TonB-dependent siderophore receptor [uncultured Martelella sp.]
MSRVYLSARPVFLLKTSAALALLATAVPALAQDAVTVLEPVDVTVDGGDGTGPVDGYVARETRTGSKNDTPIAAIPQFVSVIGRDELDDRGANAKVDETLRYTAGVFAQPFGADQDTDWIYVRGFDASQTGMYLDGLNLWSYGFGGFQIDSTFLERVEVLQGPASVLYGGSNPGGIVNLVSKRPQPENFTYSEIGINNFGNAYLDLDTNGTTEDNGISWRFTGKVSGGDQYADQSEDFRGVLMPQITWSADDQTALNIYAYYSSLDQNTGSNGFLPYYGTVEPQYFGRIPRDANYGEPSTDEGLIQQMLVGYEFEHTFDSDWTFTSNARYGHVMRKENQPYPYGYYDPATGTGFLTKPAADGAYLTRLGFNHKTTVDSFAADNRLNGNVTTGMFDHDILVGLDYRYYQLDSVQASSTATPISVIDPVHGVPQPANSVYLDQTLTQQQLGIYAQDQIRFGGGFIATLNGRYDYVHTDLDDHLGSVSYRSNDNAVSGRAGLAYEFENGITPYVSASTFFNPLIGNSIDGPLEPEDGYQVEGGLKYQPFAFDGLFTASVFHITKNNWTVTDPLTFLDSQVGQVDADGVEFEGKVNLNDDWKLLGSFTWQSQEIKDHADPSLIGNEPYLVPNVTAAAWLTYTVPEGALEGLSLGGGIRFEGESWADMANTEKVPASTVFDLNVSYERNDWTAAINVVNLFDKEYVAGCQGLNVCGYGQSRTITASLGKKW